MSDRITFVDPDDQATPQDERVQLFEFSADYEGSPELTVCITDLDSPSDFMQMFLTREFQSELLALLLSRLSPEQKRKLFFELAGEVLPKVCTSHRVHQPSGGCSTLYATDENAYLEINDAGYEMDSDFEAVEAPSLRGFAACCLAAAAELERGQS